MAEMGVPVQEPKKGMSKGCMVTLIVVAVLVVMVIVAGLVCYAKRDELAKAGVNITVSQMQSELMANPVEGIDTVVVNRIADGFVAKVNEAEFDAGEFAFFFQTIQTIMADRVIDAEEAQQFMETMVTTYPDLEELMPDELPVAMDELPVAMDDTVSVEDDSLETEQ